MLKNKWNTLKEIVYVLRIPYNATIAIQAKNLTLSDFFGEWLLMEIRLNSLIARASFNKTNLADKMLSALLNRKDQLINHPAMLAALYLDPRFRSEVLKKQSSVDVAKSTIENIWERICDLKINETTVDTCHVETDSFEFELDGHEELDAFLESAQISSVQENVRSAIVTAINSFNPDKMKTSESLNKFWESMKKQQPELYEVAMVVLAIPPTEVQIERDFSALANVFGPQRYSLREELLRDILTIHLNKDLFHDVKKDDIDSISNG